MTGHTGHTGYGAAITRRQYVRVTLAAGIGSVLEWYDYTVLIAMSPSIQAVFFPPGDLAAKQLSFWSVYAVGYIFRPLGSLLFGHICDVHGRRLSLMITLLMMAVPTVLIGCLPTYTQVGLAAPILLSLLRLVQGIAVGGELGTAVVFMHELAPAKHKTKGGSIIFLGVTAGILMGIIVSMIVTAAIPKSMLLVWGWRVPFLIAAITALAGYVLRYNMPESYEFEEDPVRRAGRAASRTSSSTAGQAGPLLLQQGKQVETGKAGHAAADNLVGSGAAAAADVNVQGDTSLVLQQQPQQQQAQPNSPMQCASGKDGGPSGCSWVLGHEPIRLLFRSHWREVLLLFWFETWSAANFYVFYGWLPAHIASQWAVKSELTLGMTLVNMSLTLPLIPFAAHLADKGLPRLAASGGVLALAALASVPMLLAVSSRSMAAAWLMQMCDLFLNASIFGWLPSIGSLLFPVYVRATGYNFAHTAAQSWLGGLTPLIISAIALRLQQGGAPTGSIYLVTGLYLTACAVISIVALGVMWRLFPQTNRDAGAAGSRAQQGVLLPVSGKPRAAAPAAAVAAL